MMFMLGDGAVRKIQDEARQPLLLAIETVRRERDEALALLREARSCVYQCSQLALLARIDKALGASK